MLYRLFFITGVSGSGKTTIGRLLAERLGLPFFDGDDFHPEANIEKMRSGQALTDEDRAGWLEAIRQKAVQEGSGVFACSALRERYREVLKKGLNDPVAWVLLDGDPALLSRRLEGRKGHFMPPALLQSQLDILEKPDYACVLDPAHPPEILVQHIIQHFGNMQKEFGLIGLGVMGKSLARNLAGKGVSPALYNRHVAGKEERVAVECIAQFAELSTAAGFDDLPAFVAALQTPRKIFLMVNAGAPTDEMLNALVPLLSPGDILMDGGNAHYRDTARRRALLTEKGIHWIGVGVSGGEAGALSGPSIMPGGPEAAYEAVRPYLERIAAKDAQGRPCCAYMGPDGAGHFVKMVHNGIEYAEMQLLAEAYFLLRRAGGLTPAAIADVMEDWMGGDLNGYLLEITVQILRRKAGEGYLLDQILDAASNKGTGGWATVAASELGAPATMMSAALFARYLSAFVEERVQAGALYGEKPGVGPGLSSAAVQSAYRVARMVNHHQGFQLLSAASETYGWDLPLSEIARIWTNGCIIRSVWMESIQAMPEGQSRVLLAQNWAKVVKAHQSGLENCLSAAQAQAMALPCMAAALHFLYAYTEKDSPMNLIQAQRDYFGAHTYRRKDDPGGKAVHTEW